MKKIEIKIDKYKIINYFSPIIGIFFSFLLLIIIIIIIGENPLKALNSIYNFTLSSHLKFLKLISMMIPLFFAGLAVSFAFQANIFNIGVEGQYFIGGFVGALAGIYFNLPSIIHIPAVILFSMIGGALWALIPALLKIKKNIHEVISTIMFNNIAIALVNYFVNGPFSGLKSKTNIEPRTELIKESAIFHKINNFFKFFGLNIPDYIYLDYSLIIAIIAGIFIWLIIYKTKYGFEIRSVGLSQDVSLYAGIKVKKIQVISFLVSGALAGLIGLQEIYAIRGFYTYNIASGLGFDGIAISLIGNNHPLGILLSSFLFTFLKQVGYALQINTKVPNSLINVITGVLIISIVVINEIIKRYIKNLRKKEEK